MAANEQSFLQTIERHQNIIHKVCAMYTDEEWAHQDLFQEVMLQLWKGYPAFRHEAKVSTWMYKVALHTAITMLKKQKKEDAAKQDWREIVGAAPYALPTSGANEDIQWLRRAIDRLAKGEKALVLLYLEEKSYKEISEILGLTESNVGVKLNRIKKKLRALIPQ